MASSVLRVYPGIGIDHDNEQTLHSDVQIVSIGEIDSDDLFRHVRFCRELAAVPPGV